MNYLKSTYIPGESNPVVHLKCGNLRTGFLALSLVFWLFILIFVCHFAAYSATPHLSIPAEAIIKFFSQPKAMMTGPVIILGTLMYFAYGRKRLVWDNGLIIDDKRIDVDQYQFKWLFTGVNLIYLRSGSKLWIVYPVTSQDNVKFKNKAVVQKEMAENEVQVKVFKEQLANSGAAAHRFWFFTKGFVISFAILLAVMAAVLSGLF
ncbi:hypothetical protein ACVWYN_002214 [Pedobacter sp. UYP24]